VSTIERPFELLRRKAHHPWVWLGLPIALYAWTLGGPFVFDDLTLLLKAERFERGEADRLDLYRFAPDEKSWRAMIDRGTYPWWSPESQRIDFLRPASEMLFYFDVCLFGRAVIGHRLVSLIWFAAALLVVYRLYRSAGARVNRAGVATLMFGLCQALTPPVTFVSNRSDLLVVVGVGLAGIAYWAAQRQARIVNVILAVSGFVFAMLSKEPAVAFAGVLIIHQLWTKWARVAPSTSRQTKMITLLVASAATAYVCYYLMTRTLSAGSQESALAGAAGMISKLGLYLSVWALGFPIQSLLGAGPGVITVVCSLAFLLTLISLLVLRRVEPVDTAWIFFAAWAAAFLCPALIATAEPRALAVASIGWAYLLALLIVPSEKPAPIWLRHWLLFANGGISVVATVATVLFTNTAERDARAAMKEYVAASPSPLMDGQTLIVAEAKFPFEFLCAGDRLEYLSGRRDVSIKFLTPPGTKAAVVKQDDRTLAMQSTGPPVIGQPFQRLTLGNSWKAQVGTQFKLRDFTVEITGLAEDGSAKAMSVRFAEPLSSPRYRFVPESMRGMP
jgi:hypothetical protein